MEHSLKIVIGANYGDEGKGLMSRYFTKEFGRAVTVFHNGSAQRGHTADYEDGTRHVFHNFGAGTKDGGATYYADTFLVHPMDFCREVRELGFVPEVSCSPQCLVVTPLDMLADHIIEDHIAAVKGQREYGSCGYGTWSATDRAKERPDLAFTLYDMMTKDFQGISDALKEWVVQRLKTFRVNLDLVPSWKHFFEPNDQAYLNMWTNFAYDLWYFLRNVKLASFDDIWRENKAIIFEGAQGLLLDKDRDGIWNTTSNTGLKNPHMLLSGKTDFHAEVCYVSRSYVTRHGEGPLDNEVEKKELGEELFDQTNVFNQFQGDLRYAKLPNGEMFREIVKDFSIVNSDRYEPSIAFTHCNEHDIDGGDYRSYSPHEVIRV